MSDGQGVRDDRVRVITDYAAVLADAYDRNDQAAAATALATIAWAVDEGLLDADPDRVTPAAPTHVDGTYVGPGVAPIVLRAYTKPTVERVWCDLELVLNWTGSMEGRGAVIEHLAYAIYDHFKVWGFGDGNFNERDAAGKLLSAAIKWHDASIRADHAMNDAFKAASNHGHGETAPAGSAASEPLEDRTRDDLLNEEQHGDYGLVGITVFQAEKAAAFVQAKALGHDISMDTMLLVSRLLQSSSLEATGADVRPSALEVWRELDALPWPQPGVPDGPGTAAP